MRAPVLTIRRADLGGADRWSDDAPIAGWVLRDGVLTREVSS